MNRKINFICVLVLLVFATICSLAIRAQDSLRLSRSAENQYNNSSPSEQTTQTIDTGSAFRIKLPSANSQNSKGLKGGVEQETAGSLTQIQLQKLAAHDIVLLIDKSGSMATPDCPFNNKGASPTVLSSLLFGSPFANSRWQWCRNQASQMSELTRQIIPEGFTVLLFDSNYYLFPHVNSNSLTKIFANNSPGGSTNLIYPLQAVFNDYFKRKRISKVPIKPLLIGVITDGCPDDPKSVRKMLADLTHSLQDPKDITLVFFLIGGHDSQGEKFVSDLCNKLISSGASFDIVKGVSFPEVQRLGLAGALADNLE